MLKKILNHIHTILLLIGIGFISYSLFLINEKIGFLGTGVLLVMLAMLINLENTMKQKGGEKINDFFSIFRIVKTIL